MASAPAQELPNLEVVNLCSDSDSDSDDIEPHRFQHLHSVHSLVMKDVNTCVLTGRTNSYFVNRADFCFRVLEYTVLGKLPTLSKHLFHRVYSFFTDGDLRPADMLREVDNSFIAYYHRADVVRDGLVVQATMYRLSLVRETGAFGFNDSRCAKVYVANGIDHHYDLVPHQRHADAFTKDVVLQAVQQLSGVVDGADGIPVYENWYTRETFFSWLLGMPGSRSIVVADDADKLQFLEFFLQFTGLADTTVPVELELMQTYAWSKPEDGAPLMFGDQRAINPASDHRHAFFHLVIPTVGLSIYDIYRINRAVGLECANRGRDVKLSVKVEMDRPGVVLLAEAKKAIMSAFEVFRRCFSSSEELNSLSVDALLIQDMYNVPADDDDAEGWESLPKYLSDSEDIVVVDLALDISCEFANPGLLLCGTPFLDCVEAPHVAELLLGFKPTAEQATALGTVYFTNCPVFFTLEQLGEWRSDDPLAPLRLGDMSLEGTEINDFLLKSIVFASRAGQLHVDISKFKHNLTLKGVCYRTGADKVACHAPYQVDIRPGQQHYVLRVQPPAPTLDFVRFNASEVVFEYLRRHGEGDRVLDLEKEHVLAPSSSWSGPLTAADVLQLRHTMAASFAEQLNVGDCPFQLSIFHDWTADSLLSHLGIGIVTWYQRWEDSVHDTVYRVMLYDREHDRVKQQNEKLKRKLKEIQEGQRKKLCR